ncbi:MAG: MlaE family ABC transporter permease [Bacteroidia bacterium]
MKKIIIYHICGMIAKLSFLGELGYLLFQTISNFPYLFADRKRVMAQLEYIGVQAIPLVLLIGLFAGTIIAWQGAYQLRNIASFSLLGGQVCRVIVMEMAPVLTGLIMSGRVGASMTAEIGAMKVSEQIDALKIMSIDPIRYIVMPRFFALMLMMPVLTLFAMMTAIVGSFVISNFFLEITAYNFLHSIKTYFYLQDLAGGLIKSFFFGVIIAWLGCYLGIKTTGGTKGVGESTIQSFVYASISILASDFLLWIVLF